MENLPLELRLYILRHLDARVLARASMTCAALRVAAYDDSLWRALCAEIYPHGANTGSALVPTHRDCFLHANGWTRLAEITRELISFAPSGRASRSRAPQDTISAFDADDDLLIVALDLVSDERGQSFRLELYYADGRQDSIPIESYVQHVELCDEARHGHRAFVVTNTGCWVVRPDADEPCTRCTRFPDERPGYVTHAGDDVILLTHHAGQRYDLARQTGFRIARLLQIGLEMPAREVKIMPGAVFDPLEPAITTVGARCGDRSVLYRLDWRLADTSPACFIETHHKNLHRVGAGAAGTVLTSHLFSKEVQAWDWRNRACVDSYRCCGIGPDFDAANGVLACVSRGAPGTQYGAKLHAFGMGGARAAADVGLSEVVIDSFHRNALTRGVRLCDRTLTVLLDEQRLLRMRVE